MDKKVQYKVFHDNLLKNKITLSNPETSAVTIYFGVKGNKDLTTLRAINLYNQGKILVQKITGDIND